MSPSAKTTGRPASKRHQLISTRLIAAFQNYTDEHGGAQAYPPVNLVVSEDSGLAPDLILVLEGQDDPDDPIAFRSPPALVVEIVSDARRDLVVKKEIYCQRPTVSPSTGRFFRMPTESRYTSSTTGATRSPASSSRAKRCLRNRCQIS